MNEKNLIKTVNSLLCFATAFLFIGLLAFVYDKHLTYSKDMPCKAENVVSYIPEEAKRVIYYNAALEGYYELLNEIVGLETYYCTVEGDFLGYFFITAYCPYECGYREYEDGTDNFPCGWTTATDTICYRADEEHRLTEPTTCAADPRYFRVAAEDGDLFYLPDFSRVFQAQDTGSAVLNYHIDLFYESYFDVLNFPTGYYPVYSAEIITHAVSGRERMIRQQIIKDTIKESMNDKVLPDNHNRNRVDRISNLRVESDY